MKKIFSIIFIILCSFFAVSCSSSDNKKWFEFDININLKEVSNDVISNELSMAYVATKEAYESLDVKVEFDRLDEVSDGIGCVSKKHNLKLDYANMIFKIKSTGYGNRDIDKYYNYDEENKIFYGANILTKKYIINEDSKRLEAWYESISVFKMMSGNHLGLITNQISEASRKKEEYKYFSDGKGNFEIRYEKTNSGVGSSDVHRLVADEVLDCEYDRTIRFTYKFEDYKLVQIKELMLGTEKLFNNETNEFGEELVVYKKFIENIIYGKSLSKMELKGYEKIAENCSLSILDE